MDPRNPVRAGQPLYLAAAQVNWINRQMRGDTGLRQGDVPQAEPTSLVVPVSVTSTIDNVKPGYVVRLTGTAAHIAPSSTNPNDTRVAVVSCLSGQVIIPVPLGTYEPLTTSLGVIVGGAKMPSTTQSAVVRVCVSGLCVARYRPRGGPHYYLQGSVLRGDDDEEELTGAAEATTCGNIRIIADLGAADDVCNWAAVIL
jgi:hypothetical protein